MPVIDAALERGIRQIIFLSLQGVQFNPATPHRTAEKHLRRRRAQCTFLRPDFVMPNLSRMYRDDSRECSEIYLPAARARTAFVDARDIGRVAARASPSRGTSVRSTRAMPNQALRRLSGEPATTFRQFATEHRDVWLSAAPHQHPPFGDCVFSNPSR